MKKIILILAVTFLLLASNLWAADYGAVAVGAAAVQVYAPGYNPRAIGIVLCSDPANTVTIYVASNSSVTSSSYGFPLSPGGCVILNGHLNAWWAITAGTSATATYQLLY
jgi:hypothetical protein